jgi:nudix-type nucleoside diphosphatase (YffH/AdpP family)
LKVEVQKRETLLDDYLKINVAELKIEKFDGEMSQPFRHLNLQRGEAVAVLIYLEDKNSFVFVNQFRFAVFETGDDGWIDEIVAGVLEDDTPIECAKRECLEETGFKIERFKFLGCVFASPGITSERTHLYIGFCKSSDQLNGGGGVDHEHEDIKVIEIPRKEAVKKLNNLEITDMKTVLVLQHFLANY